MADAAQEEETEMTIDKWAAATALVGLMWACQPGATPAQADPPPSKDQAVKATDPSPASEAPKPHTTKAKVDADRYPWLAEWSGDLPDMVPLAAHFAPPKGFSRVEAIKGGYADWLRGLPVRTDRDTVMSHRGDPLGSPSAAVVVLDVGKRNLQQCADSAIRLHAEYLWASDAASGAAYHFTSGDKSGWKPWQRGERFKIKGNKVDRVRGKARANTHAEFRRYLDNIFRYAGTMSLWRDSNAVKAGASLAAGDFFVQPGGPGHAVVLLDVAEHADGRRVALVGQGFMPAQEFHVVRDRGDHVIDGVWFVLPGDGGELETRPGSPFWRKEAPALQGVALDVAPRDDGVP